MRSIAIAAAVQGGRSLYAECGKFEGDDSFYLHIMFAGGEIRGIMSHEQIWGLTEMLMKETIENT